MKPIRQILAQHAQIARYRFDLPEVEQPIIVIHGKSSDAMFQMKTRADSVN
jgi:hypothetical protein